MRPIHDNALFCYYPKVSLSVYTLMCSVACMHCFEKSPAYYEKKIQKRIKLFANIHAHNTLQHTATHCNTLQHTATHCSMMSSATHCTTLRRTAICVWKSIHTQYALNLYFNFVLISLEYFCIQFKLDLNVYMYTVKHTATHCNTLQHIATLCNSSSI